MNILLVGYYGHGNFGDDVLFKASFALLRTIYPKACIDVQSEAAAPGYLAMLAEEPVRIVRLGQRGCYDLIFHGGGGNFFDFDSGTLADLVINYAMRALGLRRASRLFEWARWAFRRRSLSGSRRVGVGIGIGTHTRSSRMLRHHLRTLYDFDHLFVRDQESARNARRLGVLAPIVSSDLAFASRYWLADGHKSENGGEGELVVIVRGWQDEPGRTIQMQLVSAVRALGDDSRVRFLLLDANADSQWINELKGAKFEVYEPGQIADIMNHLSQARCWISSRAHGAICGALAGRPGLIIPIEPKLRIVAAMLPRSSKILDADDLGNLASTISMLSKTNSGSIYADVEANRQKALEMLAQIQDAQIAPEY